MSVLSTLLIFAAAAHVLSVLCLVMERRDHRAWPWWAAAIAAAAAAVCAWGFVRSHAVLALGALAVVELTRRASSLVGGFRVSGLLLWVTYLAMLALGLPWMLWFVVAAPVSATTKALMLLGSPLVVVTAPAMLVRTFENWEVLCRSGWTRPTSPLSGPARPGGPRVSIHVPAHAEPPEVVIATLDHLARLDYPDFEVVVIDNNTADERLWRPVEAHCSALGERFRFLHVEGLAGAKAGALNYALARTDPTAELIAVVDADYHAEPDFLAGTVGFFDDPAMGFVQSPHAYRDHERNRYLEMCNWEYAYFFATGMVSLNERDAAITVGTMCVIRREALEAAGGWAEWCLTEDSELAVRIHALGYSSIYLHHIYGRGLIPATFAGYKRQRFRWTYGPVQELANHWRLYLPGRWRQPSQMTVAQRIHHVTHGLYGIGVGLGLLYLPVGLAVMASMVAHHESLPTPLALWATATALLVGSWSLRWHVYRDVLGATARQTLGAWLASSSLAYVVTAANLTALLGRPVPWQRTSKFRPQRQRAGGLGAARNELLIAAACVAIAATAALLHQTGIAMMLTVGFAIQGAVFLAAPVMALNAELSLRRRPPVSQASASAGLANTAR